MRYKNLGHTGLRVSEICLGAMTFGGRGFHKMLGDLDQATADRVVARSLDAGVNFIDTANIYSQGQSEEVTGQAIANSGRARSEIVLATKAFGQVGSGQNDRGTSRGHLMNAVKDSLRRLNTDYIDLYQMHGLDLGTPIEETLRALDDLVSQGHIRYVGVSNWSAWALMKSLGVAERHGWTRPATLQAHYSIASRDLEREFVQIFEQEKVGLLAWSPLGGGLLSGKFDREGKGPEGSRRMNLDFPPIDKQRAFSAIDAMRAIADARGVSVARIALAWVLQRPFVTSTIIGARTVEQLDDNLAATEIVLGADELAALDTVSALPVEYPAWMIQWQAKGPIASK